MSANLAGKITITKPADMPQALYDAIVNDPYEQVGDISVTQLISAPRMVELIRRHAHEIVEDADDRIWALLGQAVHTIIERAADKNALHEERLAANLDGFVLSGKPDLLTEDGTLEDWKVTSVWSFQLGDKIEWENQLNTYAWLYAEDGFQVLSLRIQAILRDWMKSKALADPSYPQKARLTKSIPLWTWGYQTDFVWERTKLHRAARHMRDDNLPLCTPEERWERPTTWAVKKKGAKRALKVFEDENEALEYHAHVECGRPGKDGLWHNTHEIETRPGKSVRCESYCLAAPHCSQFAEMKGAENGEL